MGQVVSDQVVSDVMFTFVPASSVCDSLPRDLRLSAWAGHEEQTGHAHKCRHS